MNLTFSRNLVCALHQLNHQRVFFTVYRSRFICKPNIYFHIFVPILNQKEAVFHVLISVFLGISWNLSVLNFFKHAVWHTCTTRTRASTCKCLVRTFRNNCNENDLYLDCILYQMRFKCQNCRDRVYVASNETGRWY
jgi:hypothetical protein